MGVSRGKGWTEADIDKEDPEAYHGGGIVTPGMALQEKQKEQEKKRKKRIEEQRKLLADMQRKRSQMEETI